MEPDSFIVTKISWSFSGWNGFDIIGYENRHLYDYEIVRKYGVAWEWWNFDQTIEPPYFWGHIPNLYNYKVKEIKKFFDNKTIIFISENPITKRWFVIGIYEKVRVVFPGKYIIDRIPRPYIFDIKLKNFEWGKLVNVRYPKRLIYNYYFSKIVKEEYEKYIATGRRKDQVKVIKAISERLKGVKVDEILPELNYTEFLGQLFLKTIRGEKFDKPITLKEFFEENIINDILKKLETRPYYEISPDLTYM